MTNGLKFWVVTDIPSLFSSGTTIRDIMFQTDVKGMMVQTLSGLRPDDVVGVYRTKKEAEFHAKRIMKKYTSSKKATVIPDIKVQDRFVERYYM